MKITMIFKILLLLLFYSCRSNEQNPITQDPNTLDIPNLEWEQSNSAFTVTLLSEDGNEVMSTSSLKPETRYILRFKGDKPINFKIETADGFKVVNSNIERLPKDFIVDYQIETLENVPEQLYLKVIPIYIKENSFIKESPQNFLLPNS